MNLESLSVSLSPETQNEKNGKKGLKLLGLEVEKLALSGWHFKENGERERERGKVVCMTISGFLSSQHNAASAANHLFYYYYFFLIHLYYYLLVSWFYLFFLYYKKYIYRVIFWPFCVSLISH